LSTGTLRNLWLDAVSNPTLYILMLLPLRAVVLTTLERIKPAQCVSYRDVWWRDGAAWVTFAFVVAPIAVIWGSYFKIRAVFPAAVVDSPFVVRFLLFLVVTDFAYYWVHRSMHARHLWRIHKWHHAPTYMYWLAGARGSLMQTFVLYLVLTASAGTLLDISPWWTGTFVVTLKTLQNDWMHLNVRCGCKWLEWFLVTPRYHHIHHSTDPEHHRRNLGAMFTVWDRLFGTYFNPDAVPRTLSFGINEHVPATRLILGF
jgi:sterol desaturase/sphingolipid hydroxylase (fatty acid hydroxylase superfamily)